MLSSLDSSSRAVVTVGLLAGLLSLSSGEAAFAAREPAREINVHFRGLASLPVDFGPQVLAVRTRLGVPATGQFRLANLTGSPLTLKASFVSRPDKASRAFQPLSPFPVTRLRPHESRTVAVRFQVRPELDVHTPEIYVEYQLEPAR